MRILLGLVLVAGCGSQSSNSPKQDESWKEPWHQPQTALPSTTARVAVGAEGKEPPPAPKVPRCTPTTSSSTPSVEFDKAERYYNQVYRPFEIARTPKTEEEAKREFGELVERKDKAIGNYEVFLGPLSSKPPPMLPPGKRAAAYWEIAANVRIGEIHEHAAKVVLAIPAPAVIYQPAPSPPASVMKEYEDAMESLVAPMRAQAKAHWKLAISRGKEWCIDSEWTQLAKQHLHRP